MTAKHPRSKQAGGRVTPKGTKPEGATTKAANRSAAVSHKPMAPRVDPVRGNQFSGHAGPSRSAHRGNR